MYNRLTISSGLRGVQALPAPEIKSVKELLLEPQHDLLRLHRLMAAFGAVPTRDQLANLVGSLVLPQLNASAALIVLFGKEHDDHVACAVLANGPVYASPWVRFHCDDLASFSTTPDMVLDRLRVLCPVAFRSNAIVSSRFTSSRLSSGANHFGVLSLFHDATVKGNEAAWLETTAGLISAALVRMALQEVEQSLQAEVDRLNSEVRSALKRAEDAERKALHLQALTNIDQFAGSIAHDFNNMLAIISGQAELIGDAIEDDDFDKAFVSDGLKNLQDAVDKAAKLTERIRAATHLRTQHLATVPVESIIRNLVNLVGPLLGTSIKLQTNLHEELGLIVADTSQIEQAILNLVINARDAMPTGGTITLSCTQEPQSDHGDGGSTEPVRQIRIAVTDTGNGIPLTMRERVFEPFFTTKLAKGGSGLGLSMVREIVERHGGRVALHSDVKVGTTVEIFLPAHVSDSRQVSAVSALISPVQVTGVSHPLIEQTDKASVLITDDDYMLRELMTRALSSAGYRVFTAADGSEALEFLNHSGEQIDLLITDVFMPRISGIELARRLHETSPDTPVLIITGFAEQAMQGSLQAPGALPMLMKPFKIQELFAKVASLMVA